MPPIMPTARSRLSGQTFGQPTQNTNPYGAGARIGAPTAMRGPSATPRGGLGSADFLRASRPAPVGGGMGWVGSAKPTTPGRTVPATATATQGMPGGTMTNASPEIGNALSAML